MREVGNGEERERERDRQRESSLPVACSLRKLNSASRRCELALAFAVLAFLTNFFCFLVSTSCCMCKNICTYNSTLCMSC